MSMMEGISKEKREYEDAAVAALSKRDFALAFKYTFKAAECALRLAKQTDGAMSDAYVNDANCLLNAAERILKNVHQT